MKTNRTISQQELYATLAKVMDVVTQERKTALRNLWRQDLNLIPKKARIWIDVGLAVYTGVALIILPAFWMATTSNVADICLDAIGIGTVAVLMYALFIYRAIRGGKVQKDVLTEPFTTVYQAVRKIMNPKKVALAAIAILGIITSTVIAEVDVNSSPAEKRAWIEQQEAASGQYTVHDKGVSIREFNGSMDKDYTKEKANMARINSTGTEGVDDHGRVEYTTPDGTKHGFRGDNGEAITKEEHNARAQAGQQFREQYVYQKEMTMAEIDAKLKVARAGLDQQERNSQARQAQMRIDIETMKIETAEMEKQFAERKAKNAAAYKKASLTSWDEFTTKDKMK